jgi:hypothetical protein
MHEHLLERYRAHALTLISQARSATERDRIAKENAECVLRNRSKLLARRLENVGTESGRRRMLREAFAGF